MTANESSAPRAPRVLLVDDDPATRFFIRTALESQGMQVLEAEDGEEGLAMFAQHRPALVVLDYKMPRLDGLACCRRLRADPAGATVPVMMLTGMEDPKLPQAALAAGADRFFMKPTNWLALASAARAMVGAG